MLLLLWRSIFFLSSLRPRFYGEAFLSLLSSLPASRWRFWMRRTRTRPASCFSRRVPSPSRSSPSLITYNCVSCEPLRATLTLPEWGFVGWRACLLPAVLPQKDVKRSVTTNTSRTRKRSGFFCSRSGPYLRRDGRFLRAKHYSILPQAKPPRLVCGYIERRNSSGLVAPHDDVCSLWFLRTRLHVQHTSRGVARFPPRFVFHKTRTR